MGRAHFGVTSHVGKRAITLLLRGVPASTEIPFLIESWLRVLQTGLTCYCGSGPVSSNGAENRVKASSLLNRFSILLKNKKYMGGRNPASLRVTVAVRLRSHRKRPLRRHGDQRATFMQAIGFISLMIDGV
jgi:hypothetical protein